MADVTAQIQEEVTILQGELDRISAKTSEIKSAIRATKKEMTRIRSGLGGGGGGGGGGDVSSLMAKLRDTQDAISKEEQDGTQVDSDMEAEQLQLYDLQQTAEQLEEEIQESTAAVQNEERKQRQAQERHTAAEREAQVRAGRLEQLARLIQDMDRQLQAERARGASMGGAAELADQLAELDTLKGLLNGLEEDMADGEEILAERDEKLEAAVKQRESMEMVMRGMVGERDQLKHATKQMKTDLEKREREMSEKEAQRDTFKSDIETIRGAVDGARGDAETMRLKMRSMQQEIMACEGAAQHSRAQLQALQYTAREREANMEQLTQRKRHMEAVEEEANKVLTELEERVENAGEQGEWAVGRLQRVLEIKARLKVKEHEKMAELLESCREQKDSDLQKLREQTEESERKLERDAKINLTPPPAGASGGGGSSRKKKEPEPAPALAPAADRPTGEAGVDRLAAKRAERAAAKGRESGGAAAAVDSAGGALEDAAVAAGGGSPKSALDAARAKRRAERASAKGEPAADAAFAAAAAAAGAEPAEAAPEPAAAPAPAAAASPASAAVPAVAAVVAAPAAGGASPMSKLEALKAEARRKREAAKIPT